MILFIFYLYYNFHASIFHDYKKFISDLNKKKYLKIFYPRFKFLLNLKYLNENFRNNI